MSATEGALVLGVDIGTGSTKGVLCRPDGSVVATATRQHRASLPRAGHVEMDADAQWWDEVADLTRELVAGVGPEAVAGVCVTGLGPCLVLVDDAGDPVGPAVLYGVDTRAAEEIDLLTERLGAEEVERRCGAPLSSQAVGPKLLWWRRHDPEGWARARAWHGASSFVVSRLTGEVAMDHHTASQCDPLYDLRTHDWSRDWAGELLAHLPLPRLVRPADVVGHVHEEAADRTGLAEGTPVVAGTVDAWAEALSAGVRAPGDTMLMYGSTTFTVTVLDGLHPAPPLWTTAGVDEGSYTLAGGTSTAGALTEWVRDLTGGAPFGDLVDEARSVPAGSEGLLVLPYLAGERTPVMDPRARGVVAGLTLRHGRGHLYRACLEGISLGVAQMLASVEEAAGRGGRLVAVGGGTQGGLWTQLVSDVTGREQQLPEVTVGASHGAALLAATGVGLVATGTDWSRVAGTVSPDPSTAEVYAELGGLFRDLYPATRETVHRLGDLADRRGG